MNNRKARLLLKVPAASVGCIATYNISNTRRMVILGELRGVIKRGREGGLTATGRRVRPFEPTIHNLPSKATGNDYALLRQVFAPIERYKGGIISYTKDI